MTERRILMGNEAIGRGIVECGCRLAASYPGTPASEILESTAAFARETGARMHCEWSVNEKVAYETALAASMSGLRAAVAMKQVGLNVAADPFMRSAYLGVIGGLLLVSADDPGPHSSQTEQDSRFFARFAKVPVLDPSSPREAREMVAAAYDLSERHQIPVMLRPTTRVCHARQPVPLGPLQDRPATASFTRDPRRWCATPGVMKELHRLLNAKIAAIAREAAFAPRLTPGDGSRPGHCLVASGVAWAHVADLLEEMGLLGRLDLWQVILPYPLNHDFIINLKNNYQHLAVIEETYPVIEMQLAHSGAAGRLSGLIPDQGELTPEVLRESLAGFLGLPPAVPVAPGPPGTRPTLCAGCGHRAAFYAIKRAFPRGIFPADIGCYTLGVNLEAVDACHCMGAGISQAAGLFHAHTLDGGPAPPLVATIGDSTFFHAGIPALINAVTQGARFILVILDNSTTAMTGHQPTPQQGITITGEPAKRVLIPDLVRACGVEHLWEGDPYDIRGFITRLKEADAWCRSPGGGVAVLIARHPCVLDRKAAKQAGARAVSVTNACTGCRHCVEAFECPALSMDEAAGRAAVDQARCIGCGVCVEVCPADAITAA